MRPMTPAEKEASRRVCEMLGTMVCVPLIWNLAAKAVLEKSRPSLFIDWLTTVLLIGILVGVAHLATFCWLDGWWRKVYANYGVELRPNWAVIPFFSAWLAFGSISLCFDVIDSNGRWLFVSLAVAIAWGLVTWCVMLCFWLFGFIIRTLRNWTVAKP